MQGSRTTAIIGNIFTFSRRFLMASRGLAVPTSSLSSEEVELVSRVHSHFPDNEPDKFHFFYETASPFSNFHSCTFAEDGVEFDTSERYMMYHKASKKSNAPSPLRFAFSLKNYSAMMTLLRPSSRLPARLTARRWAEACETSTEQYGTKTERASSPTPFNSRYATGFD